MAEKPAPEAAGAYKEPTHVGGTTPGTPRARDTGSNPLPKILAALGVLAALLLLLWALGVFGDDDNEAYDNDPTLDRPAAVEPVTPAPAGTPGSPATTTPAGTLE